MRITVSYPSDIIPNQVKKIRMCWSVKQTKITVLLLLFCSVLCTHAQVCNRCVEMPDSGFISYRLEGEPAHRLFLQEDTLRVKVKGMGLFPPYTLFYVIAQDGCLRRIGFLLIHGNMKTVQLVIDNRILQYIGGVLRFFFSGLGDSDVGNVHTLWLFNKYRARLWIPVTSCCNLMPDSGMTGSCSKEGSVNPLSPYRSLSCPRSGSSHS